MIPVRREELKTIAGGLTPKNTTRSNTLEEGLGRPLQNTSRSLAPEREAKLRHPEQGDHVVVVCAEHCLKMLPLPPWHRVTLGTVSSVIKFALRSSRNAADEFCTGVINPPTHTMPSRRTCSNRRFRVAHEKTAGN